MPKTIDAIYENGVFKPLEKLDMEEHKKIRIILAVAELEVLEQIPKPVQQIIEHLKGPLPTRSIEDLTSDTEIDVD